MKIVTLLFVEKITEI